MSNTERVTYEKDGATWHGTVVRRFEADDNGEPRRMVVVQFGAPDKPGPEHFMDESDLTHVSYDASVVVPFEDMDSPEGAALSLVTWLRGDFGAVTVQVKGSDAVTYTVEVSLNREDPGSPLHTLDAELSGIRTRK